MKKNNKCNWQSTETFPEDPLRGALYDELNKFMDTANHNLFHTYGLLQTQFDAVIASIWLYWRPTSLFANSRGFVSARCVINYFSKVLKKFLFPVRTELNLPTVLQVLMTS